MTTPTEDFVRAALNAALRDLSNVDRHLLQADCSERSLTHQLAVHLSRQFGNHNVDCEYNRDGFDIKRLELARNCQNVSINAIDAVTAFPDIIVHVRGTRDSNLLVLEVKKLSSARDSNFDLKKLAAFKSQLTYKHAVLVTLGLDEKQTFVAVQKWL
jgi:hypothetical protein